MTRFYSGGAAPGSPAVAGGWESSAGLLRCAGSPKAGDYAQQRNTSQVGTGVANQDGCHQQWIIGPVAAATLSGSVKGQQFAREGAGAVDGDAQLVIRVFAPDFSTVRGTALDFDTSALSNEFPISTIDTSVTNRKWPKGGSKALSSVSMQAGDYIVVEWGHRNHGTDTSGVRVVSGEASATTDLPEDETTTGNLTGGSTYRGWIEFTQDITLYAAPTGAITPAGAVGVQINSPVPSGALAPSGAVTAAVVPIPGPPVIEARIGWRPEQFNHVTNPDFETNTTGWAVTAGINGAATSITRITTDSHSGSACGSLVCPATALTGVNFDFGSQSFYAFTYGRHFYRFVVWLKAVSGTPYARIIVGSEGTSSDRASKDVVLTTEWQPFFVDWDPSATRTDVQLAIVNIPAVAMTARIDDVAVYLRDALTQVENGNFTDDTGGWVVTAGINAAATSITRVAADSPISGKACGELVTTATNGSGCDYDLGTVKFTSGRTYRLAVWLKSVSGTTSARLRLGSLGTAADRGDASITLTSAWARYTVDWTPSADRTDVELAISNGTAAAMTARIAAVELFEAIDDVSADAANLVEPPATSSSVPVLTFGRGASFDNAGAATGFANFTVTNTSGKYTKDNASSVLYGLLQGGRMVLIRARYNAGLWPLFGGRLRRLVPLPMSRTVQLVCTDPLEDLRRIQYSVAPYTYGYGDHRVVALTARDIRNYGTGTDAAGAIESTRFWTGLGSGGHLLPYLEELNEATGSVHFVRPDADALVVWRLITVDRTVHSDASSTSETWDDDLADLTGYDVTEEAIVNRQRVEVTPYRLAESVYAARAQTPGSGSIIDDVDGTFRIGSGDFTVTMPEATMPLTVPANTRRVLRFVSSVPLYQVGVAISYTSGSATETVTVENNEITVTLDAGSTDAVLSSLNLGGQPVYETSVNDADEAANDSVFTSGERQGLPVTGRRVNTPAQAYGLALWRLWRYSVWRGRPSAQVENLFARQLAREVTDRIALNFARLSLSGKVLGILSLKTSVYDNSLRWVTTYDLEELPSVPAGGWFTLDSSALDSSAVLAY